MIIRPMAAAIITEGWSMILSMIHTFQSVVKQFSRNVVMLEAATLLMFTFSYSYSAEKVGSQDEAQLWDEIASVRFQAARGQDFLGNSTKEVALSGSVMPGDELDSAGDKKYLAFEDYQMATTHWEKAAKGFRTAGDMSKARNAMENADAAWEAARASLRDGTEIYRIALQYYGTTNLEKKSALLRKIARNLERLIEIKNKPPLETLARGF
ncbi:MAG TPA: hypothetical protein VE689_11375 [Candidatus Udaeobacter sp.]|nr:hypothetical protein [Candidatus Udaeobacter sp.]